MSDGGINELGGVAKPYIDEIFEHIAEKASVMGSAMKRCAEINVLIKELKDRAVDDGVRRRALNQTIKRLELERKIAGLGDDLEEEDQDQFKILVESLGSFGELPLGGAALRAAEGKPGKPDDPDTEAPKRGRGEKATAAPVQAANSNSLDELGADPRPQFLKDKELQRQDEATERLKGMKTLDEGDAAKTIN